MKSAMEKAIAAKEALENIQDAMAGYIASLEKHGEPVPPQITDNT